MMWQWVWIGLSVGLAFGAVLVGFALALGVCLIIWNFIFN